MRGFSYSSHAPCRGGGAPGRSVSRASAAWIGQRGVAEYPCTVFSKPRSDWEAVATGNHHTSALGVKATSTFPATHSSGQKKVSLGNAAGSHRELTGEAPPCTNLSRF